MATIDSSVVKSFFKEATDADARRMYDWATGAMEVRGLIAIAEPMRRKRKDAGMPRSNGLPPEVAFQRGAGAVDAAREHGAGEQSSLTGLPDEDHK